MKKLLTTQIFCICIYISYAQIIYVSTIQNEIYRLNIESCTYDSITALSLPVNDITFHPDGTLYGINNTCWLFTIDTISGSYFPLHQFPEEQCNSLTASANGLIYVTGPNGNLWTYDPSTNEATYLGNTGFAATGDLTFYKGNLFVATTEDRIVRIDLSNPSKSNVILDGEVEGEIYGIVSYSTSCDSLQTYALTSGLSDVYLINFETGSLQQACSLDISTTGGASTYEYLASLTKINTEIKKYICNGSEFEGYNNSGIFIDTFKSANGCDSVRTLHLNVIVCSPIVYYNLDACESFMSNGSHLDYAEFIPSFPFSISCAEVSADHLWRSQNPDNKHSCTPGINNSPAMCITTSDTCEYIPGHAASIIIEFTLDSDIDSVSHFTGLEFYEKSPITFSWINGPEGLNNYPKFYGIRILRNGDEIFRRTNIGTNANWEMQKFDFIDDTLFRVNESVLFRIELLPYCLAGNGADVSAWDIDEIKIYGGCFSPISVNPIIQGRVISISDQPIPGVEIQLQEAPSLFDKVLTNEFGRYYFDDVKMNSTYEIKGYRNDDALNGVTYADLILIQKHLLGISPFTSLHQFIAADINGSGNVNVLDLLELKKMLSGIYSEYPTNTSWRFGTLPQNMNDFNISHFKESGMIEYIHHNYQGINFMGIKIGDLDGDARLQRP